MTIPARLDPLLQQFDFALDRLITRLDGLTDDEYLWEPVAGCWSVRPRDRIRTDKWAGGGGWALEFESPEPDPPPVTTIAWRLCHLGIYMTLRADYTTGTKAMAEEDIEIPGGAANGIAFLVKSGATWRTVLAESTDADLDQVGRSQFWGLDPRLPFLDIVWWVNQELLHHGGEIALLRDLYRARTE